MIAIFSCMALSGRRKAFTAVGLGLCLGCGAASFHKSDTPDPVIFDVAAKHHDALHDYVLGRQVHQNRSFVDDPRICRAVWTAGICPVPRVSEYVQPAASM